MLKLIAAIKYLAQLADRIGAAINDVADTLWDVRQRVAGAALTATAQRIVENNRAFEQISLDQQNAAVRADEELRHNLKAAHAAFSAELRFIGERSDAERAKFNDKAGKLREKHTKLRALL